MAILRPQRLIFSAMYSFFRGEAESGLRKAPGPVFFKVFGDLGVDGLEEQEAG